MRTFTHNLTQMLLVFFVFLSFSSSAQTKLENALNNIDVLENYDTEKVYLHLDRTIFAQGESVWFKAYLLEGTYHTLTSSTNNLHVELISSKGKIISNQVILMHEGVGYGDIKIPLLGCPNGSYKIRAYTNFMRNFDEHLFFTKKIIVNDSSGELAQNIKHVTKDIDLQFFPEGGYFVENCMNRVAFKAIDQNGKGVNLPISIFDNNNKKIVGTASTHKGMGQFMITPESDAIYYARIELPDFKDKKTELPKPETAYSILVGNQYNELLDFNICTSPNNAKKQQVSYIIQSRGKLYSSAKIKMNESQKSVRIEKDKLPAGISSITVYNEKGIPVCERLIYNQLSPEVNIKVSANKETYETREKVNLEIETRDKKGNATPANLSLAVIGTYISDRQKDMLPHNGSVAASILLLSDLKGHIENPDFYFDNFDKKKHAYLDLLLLTQGWRKYVWKEKVDKKDANYAFDYENGFTITGTSKTLALKRKIPNSRVSLVMSEDDGFYYDEVISDEKGRFTFANTHYMDSTTLVFQAYNKKDKRNTTIEVDEIKYLPPLSLGFDEELWNSEAEDFNAIAQQAEKIKEIEDSLAQKNYQLLQQITVKAEKKRNPNKHYKIYNQPDEVIEVTEEYAGYLDVFEIVDKQIPGIRVQGFCPEIEVYIRGVRTLPNTMTKTTAEFLLDGMFVSANDLCSIDVTMIDKIEILKGNSAAVFGHRGMNGIIAVYLDQAGKRWEYVPVGIVKKEPKGYYRSREFYSPNYDTAPEQFEGPDYRNTLHWAPFITTGKDGKTSVSFFNSDDSGEYEITVEGISAEGGLGKSITSFSVKPDNLSNN